MQVATQAIPVLALENDGDIADYYDATTHVYGHKFWGLLSFF